MRRALLGIPAVLAAGVWIASSGGAGAADPPPLRAQPMLGVADASTVLMGAAGGETWAYRRLPRASGAPSGVDLGPGDGQQLAFLRYTDATGWQVVQTPLDAAGNVTRGPDPNRASPRISSHGGGVLVGRGTSGVSVLVRQPGGRFREAPAPPSGMLAPADPTPTPTPTPSATPTSTPTPTPTATPTPAPEGPEVLAEDGGAGRIADAAYESGGATQVLLGVLGRKVESAVLHYDAGAGTWTREPVDVGGAQQTEFTILAVDATDAGAWLLGADGTGTFALFEREGDGTGAHWAPRSFTPPAGLDLSALGPSADPLTVTADGVWVDAMRPGATDATFFRASDGTVTSWCDATVCDHPFGARFSHQAGYRSIAFSGGARVISNPVPPGGADEDNRGAYLVRRNDTFVRMPGGGGSFRPSAAFSSPTQGWLEGPVQIGSEPAPNHLQQWPASVRAPLTAGVTAPGQPDGSLDSAALAVGGDGGVLRYAPSTGWTREFLLSASGSVSKPLLRGVAWPEPGRAHAVGDLGAMWMWRAETGLWEKDPAAPVGFEGNLMGIAFQPGDPLRGYAVGKQGVLLRYDKTWTQEALPDGFADANLTSVTFAGTRAIVAAGGDLLINDGDGWKVDDDVRRLFSTLPGADPSFTVVAGLGDGGAVAGGAGFVIERDGPSSPWRFSTQPLLGATPVALAALRSGGTLRALASVQPQLAYPVPDVLPETDPSEPTPLIPPFPLPADGYLVRETADGWSDEQRTSYFGSTADRPLKADPIMALLVDGDGQGWALGGWSGEGDAAGRGNAGRTSQGRSDRARVQTGGVYRYSTGAQPPPPAVTRTGVALPGSPARFAIAGHAQCEESCADLRDASIGPDRTLAAAESMVEQLHQQPGGPRMLLYTGGRLPAAQTLGAADADRYAELLTGGAPSYAALSAADSQGGSAGAFTSAFAAAPSPFGSGPAPGGVAPVTGLPGGSGARTHYAFDSDGSGGPVRVVVIDNSRGSLAASDPYQNPAEPQAPWLRDVLADAKAKRIPAIVIGSRDLNSRFQPSLNVADDADAEAQLLVDGGASAYFFERPEENRMYTIPSGAATTIPAYGSGTLGYRSALANTTTGPDAVFGDAAVMLAEVDTSKRDATTNRAPVTVRLLPVISDLTLQAVDGTLLRRSRPSLFQGLGRRTLGGDRWGVAVGGGDPQPPGSDPYTALPPDLCTGPTCSTRIEPEFEFSSSDPDIGDFVARDPASTNLRKPLIGAGDKVVTDHSSGLFCPFNAGTTTVTVKAGGLAYSAPVTVQAGSVQRPCGTRPLDPSRFKPRASAPAGSVPPGVAPAGGPAPAPITPPPPPAPQQERQHEARTRPPAAALPPPPVIEEPLPPPAPQARGAVPVPPPPPAGAFARPIPPGGAVIRVFEEKREEEAAPEQSSAALAYRYRDHAPTSVFLYGAIVLAAFAGASLRLGVSRRQRGISTAAVHVPISEPYRPRSRRR